MGLCRTCLAIALSLCNVVALTGSIERQVIADDDFEDLRLSALEILETELRSHAPYRERMALFCATLAADESALHLFQVALNNEDAQMQLLALQGLYRYHNSDIERALRKTMNSPYLALRLAAAQLLADGRYPCALEHIEGLMHKCPDGLWPFFPPLYAALGTPGAERTLKRLLTHPNRDVRVAAILSIAEHGLESLTAPLKALATHVDITQQEAAAYALGTLQDRNSLPHLRQLASSRHATVALAACRSLYLLGEDAYLSTIVAAAKKGDLYAISLLGQFEGQQEVLLALTHHKSSGIRLNATIALLQQGDSRAATSLLPFLLTTPGSRPIGKIFSPGKSLFYYSLAAVEADESFLQEEIFLRLREKWLSSAFQRLPESTFLGMAHCLLAHSQNDLTPQLFELLSETSTEASEAFLLRYSQQLGVPLVRYYSHLALLRSGIEGSSRQLLQKWTEEQWHNDLTAFRPLVIDKDGDTHFELKPHETTALFLTALEALIDEPDENTVGWLLKGLNKAHPNLRSAFAALLIRTLH